MNCSQKETGHLQSLMSNIETELKARNKDYVLPGHNKESESGYMTLFSPDGRNLFIGIKQPITYLDNEFYSIEVSPNTCMHVAAHLGSGGSLEIGDARSYVTGTVLEQWINSSPRRIIANKEIILNGIAIGLSEDGWIYERDLSGKQNAYNLVSCFANPDFKNGHRIKYVHGSQRKIRSKDKS